MPHPRGRLVAREQGGGAHAVRPTCMHLPVRSVCPPSTPAACMQEVMPVHDFLCGPPTSANGAQGSGSAPSSAACLPVST